LHRLHTNNKLPPLEISTALNERDLLVALLLQNQALHASIFVMYKHLQENPAWPQAKDFDALYAECYAAAHHDMQAVLNGLSQEQH
jgi:hypothetical protein